MVPDLLPSLAKAGGIAALAIGVVYLIYKEIIKLGVFPRLKQWQGFALLCFLATLVFLIAMVALLRQKETTAFLDGELPPENHFQLDASAGVFCENKNVRDDSAPFFDMIDINLSACSGTSDAGSRTYRVAWPAQGPRSLTPDSRRNYRQCFLSDLSERAPKLVSDLRDAFGRVSERVPCKVSISISRLISLSYNDLHNQSRTVAFVQSYNRGDTGRFAIEQVPTTNLARSDQMQDFDASATGSALDELLVTTAAQFRFPNVPRGN